MPYGNDGRLLGRHHSEPPGGRREVEVSRVVMDNSVLAITGNVPLELRL